MPKVKDDIDYSLAGQEEVIAEVVDLPITYVVERTIVDPTNPKSIVEFKISLEGPNREDLGTRVIQQSLDGINEKTINALEEQLGSDAAKALYESNEYAKLLKVSPKKAKKTAPKEQADVDLTEVTTKVTRASAKTDKVITKVESMATTTEAVSSRIAILEQDNADMKRMLAEIQSGQSTLAEWLAQIRTILVS